MTKAELESRLKEGRTRKDIAQEYGITTGALEYWVKKYSLKACNSYAGPDYTCFRCGVEGEQNFYRVSKKRCKKCYAKYIRSRRQSNRTFALEELGGRCSLCGYNKCLAALDIHHIKPELKSKNWISHPTWPRDRLLEELKTCQLLCKNCHTEKHYNLYPRIHA